MRILTELLPQALLIEPKQIRDDRGDFVKTYHEAAFERLGVKEVWREEFFSVSKKGVLRGMHFQAPPASCAKIVFCASGRALDVILDLRRSSPTFGTAAGTALDDRNRHLLYLPAGFAHGFLALADETIMIYKTSALHAPECDLGIRWDSIPFDWGIAAPILSPRDAGHPPLARFESPF
jgi:dTDP-4-dehydrorhamnose 3,5-epimerase